VPSSSPTSMLLKRPSVMSVMRGIRDRAENYLEKGKRLTPPYNQIAVGGAHIDELARGWALITLLDSLNKGMSLKASLERAKEEARLWFSKWNASRPKEYQVYRRLESADDTIEYAYRQIRQAMIESLRR
jgi:hypothetical protein